MENSIFKSLVLEQQFMTTYDEVIKLSPVTFENIKIQNQYGITHIHAVGEMANPPLLLLPGFGANSGMWFSNIAALSQFFRIYAVDTPGQPGKSIPGNKLTTKNCSDWINLLLDGLKIERANFMGLSLGGWITLNFTIQYPTRVNKAILLDPAASFDKMSPSFIRHSIVPFMIAPTRNGLRRFFKWMTQGYQVNPLWGNLMIQGILNTKPQPPLRATPFSDQEIREIQRPILLLVGGRSVIYDPQSVITRVNKLNPIIQAEIIPDASHALNDEKAEIVNSKVIQFLKRMC